MDTTRHSRAALAGMLALVLTFGLSPAAMAHVGNEGCTPGYWKTHLDTWAETTVPWTPETPLGWKFDVLNAYPVYADLADDTFLEALKYRGGPSLVHKAQILLRAATASVLNATATGSSDVDFLYTTHEVEAIVTDALSSMDKDAIIAAADLLDAANNGPDGCPLS